MPLSWNEIRDRATAFAHDWAGDSYERGEAQTFWNEFFQVFGLSRRRVASFEAHVSKLDGPDQARSGFIDCFWPGTLIAEHKSRGKDLDSAYLQAVDYFAGLKERDLPQYVMVSDFAHIRIHDLDSDTRHEFPLSELPKQIKRFGFIAGYKPQVLRPENPVNVKAAERMGRLHDTLKDSGYQGHPLEMLLVRLLFCLFAEDTGIFQPAQAFRQWLEDWTAEDGSDLGSKLAHAFQILNTPHDKRSASLNEQLAAFPYVNGRLFEETLPIAAFDSRMRDALLDACALDWSQISPAVFGAMFQSIMDGEARRNLGAHYTSEQNIEKLIKPLFLDELRAEFERVKHNRNRLFEFHKKLRTLTFLDPACGCGNFLVVTYRALRELELDVLRASRDLNDPYSRQLFDVHSFITIDVDQFFGIEIEEFPARIAEVALWLTDHQMNVKVGEEFGMYFARIPLKATPHIHHHNALRMDWEDVVPKERLSYIIGNPPFSGAMVMTDVARADMAAIFHDLKGSGVLDFVACWYWRAAKYVAETDIEVGFVSTNSITQGEQVGLLWRPIIETHGMRIRLAHRTFRWSNEAKGKAAVHCVIIGFSRHEPDKCVLYDYPTVDSAPDAQNVDHINAYLVAAPDVFLPNRSSPLSDVPKLRFGNMPRDGGHLLLSPEERDELIASEPAIEPFVLPFLSARQFLNRQKRYCLWLVDAPPSIFRECPRTLERVRAVKDFRLASRAASTRRFAETPTVFCQIAQPQGDYILVPRHSSERRRYVPFGFFSSDQIVADSCNAIPGATLFHFGVLTSAMHMAWMRYTCGRLKSDFRYSKDIVYNNFPWPETLAGAKRELIESAAQAVLDARAHHEGESLADLYDPDTMPTALLKAHRALDKAVDGAYGRRKFKGDADRVAFLFEEYARLTSLLDQPKAKRSRTKAG